MRKATRHVGALLAVLLAVTSRAPVHAQEAPVPAADQLALLKSPDPKLARNKQFVFDFWRIVYEGRHVNDAPKYMAEGYIQHNPNVGSGRSYFQDLFRKKGPPLPVQSLIKMPVITITAEGNYVTVYTVRRMRDPKDPSHIYATTWCDMFRIDGQGLIAEHWDPSPLWVDGKPLGAEFLP